MAKEGKNQRGICLGADGGLERRKPSYGSDVEEVM